jgi:hypothetical protein
LLVLKYICDGARDATSSSVHTSSVQKLVALAGNMFCPRDSLFQTA